VKFGKLEDVDHVNWTIPEDDPSTKSFLSAQPPAGDLRIRFGAPAWDHATWVGKIYPPGTKRADFLHHYSRYFSCIELNTTHYAIPSEQHVKQWLEKVPETFRFCPKVYQGISHRRNGLLDGRLLGEWFRYLELLDDRRGVCFMQLPPHFDYSQKAQLFSFLKNWPAEFELALEFRHPSWFQGPRILPALADFLRTLGVGLVITDVAGRRDVLHTSISADFSLLRFVGSRLHSSDFTRAKAWTERFISWRDQGLRELYLFIHQPDDITVPELTEIFLEELRAQGGWNLRTAKLATTQLDLLT
jgi:uncharacterized protein YecE (DUF72 family)